MGVRANCTETSFGRDEVQTYIPTAYTAASAVGDGQLEVCVYVDYDKDLFDLIQKLIECQALIAAKRKLANALATEAVKEDADSELVGNPKEEVA